MNQMERIAEMQQAMDEAASAVTEMKTALEKFRKAQEQLRKADKYYGSSAWFTDVYVSKNGELPENLKCDVLSDEGVWKLAMENRELAIEMLEAGTEIIKNG